MPSSTEMLSTAHAEAILELGRRGAGGRFDQQVLSQLFALGLIEVRNEDRRVGLTLRGRKALSELTRLQLQGSRASRLVPLAAVELRGRNLVVAGQSAQERSQPGRVRIRVGR